MTSLTAEHRRLEESRAGVNWRLWGPYLSEREWGTVREDYSLTGSAWDYFPHDQARSRTYRWGEDGLGGYSDDKQRLCFALALWNGVDPILKERLFGLTNSEGNHGEDVKEYYYYLDCTPTHSYMKYPYFDLDQWLHERCEPGKAPSITRNSQWFHMLNDDVISMPDKWEYPCMPRGTWRSMPSRWQWSTWILLSVNSG